MTAANFVLRFEYVSPNGVKLKKPAGFRRLFHPSKDSRRQNTPKYAGWKDRSDFAESNRSDAVQRVHPSPRSIIPAAICCGPSVKEITTAVLVREQCRPLSSWANLWTLSDAQNDMPTRDEVLSGACMRTTACLRIYGKGREPSLALCSLFLGATSSLSLSLSGLVLPLLFLIVGARRLCVYLSFAWFIQTQRSKTTHF